MRFASRAAATLIVAVCTAALAGCDHILSYTVVNETDDEVVTGWFSKPCSLEAEQRLRKGPLDRRVAPGESRYFGGVPAGEPRCVVIKDSSQTLTLLAPYTIDASYLVTDEGGALAVTVRLAPAPQRQDDGVDIGQVGAIAVLILFLGPALLIAARFFYRFYISKSIRSSH